jgi:hypothetical protein
LQQVKIALSQPLDQLWQLCAMPQVNLLSSISDRVMSASASLWQNVSLVFVTLFRWELRSQCRQDLPHRF